MEHLLVCPFTLQPLRALDEEELSKFHQKVETGEFFFRRGIPLTFLPQKAYISQNHVYVYIEIDGVILLQKQTAIVTRNRTDNPMRRVQQETIDAFYKEIGLNAEGNLAATQSPVSVFNGINNADDKEQLLPKTGRCFITMGTAKVDAIHNLLFGTNFREYIHLDHDMRRLQAINGNLKENSRYVLCDQDVLPLKSDSVDAVYSYEFIVGLEKETQHELFDALNRVIDPKGAALVINAGQKPSQLENRYKSVKTKAAFTPWKKQQLAQLHFQNISVDEPMSSNAFSGKKSLGSQLY